MITVRAKFKLVEKTENESGFSVRLVPVINGSEENETFFKYTPGGELKMATVNPEAAAALVVGKEYYLDFTQAN